MKRLSPIYAARKVIVRLILLVLALGVSSGGNTNPLSRGKKLVEPFDEDQLLQAYHDVKEEYHERAFGSHSWKVLREDKDMSVSLLEHPTDPSCPYVKMEGRLPVPVHECWDFLRVENWKKSMPQMDPFYEGVSVHGNFTKGKVNVVLCRKRTKRILAFGKRDLVFACVTDEPRADGTWISGTVSVVTDSIPRCKGYTRAFQDSVAFYKPVENGSMTDLTIMCRIDLNDSGEDGQGGFIPMWLYVKTIGRTGVQSVGRMRKALLSKSQ